MNTKDFSSDKTSARFQAVWSSCGIPPRLVNASFANYEPVCPEKEQALEKCRIFADLGLSIIEQGRGLFLQGPVGSGKSHLSVAVLRAILENNIDCFGRPGSEWRLADVPVYDGYYCSMISAVDYVGTIQESFKTGRLKASDQRMITRARSDAVLILDDIGAKKPSRWVEEQMYALIDLRYRMKRSTFFTTNCTLQQLESQIGCRSVSRIMETCEGVRVGGEDWRKRQKV